jgi:hypothetical protein
MQFYTLDFETFDRFYAMFDPIAPITLGNGPIKCPKCDRPIFVGYWVEPRCVKLSKPLFGDIVIDVVEGLLVSQRFKDLYEKSSLKGIKAFYLLDKVTVSRNAKKQLIPPTYYFIELEWATNAVYDPQKTVCFSSDSLKNKKNLKITPDGITRCSLCNPYNYGCLSYMRGYGIEFLDDNPLDIFHLYARAGSINFSQKFVDWALANNITNFKGKIQRTEEYVFVIEEGIEQELEQKIIDRLKRGEEY